MENLINKINKSWVIGIDIGGSHITAALVDVDNRILVPNTMVRKKVNSHASANEIIGNWSSAIIDVLKFHPLGLAKVGIAMPGPFDYENGVSWMKNIDKYDALFGMNIKESLSDNLPIASTDICMRNDAEAFLEGEVQCGAARGFKKTIGITLGTGLGSARNSNGKTEDARLGLNTLFLDGVAEDYLSTRWFVKRYHELTGKTVRNVEEMVCEDTPSVKIVLDEFKANLIKFLNIFIKMDSPDVIVIGGNLANVLNGSFDTLEKELQKQYPNIVLRKAQFGEDAALIGAAYF